VSVPHGGQVGTVRNKLCPPGSEHDTSAGYCKNNRCSIVGKKQGKCRSVDVLSVPQETFLFKMNLFIPQSSTCRLPSSFATPKKTVRPCVLHINWLLYYLFPSNSTREGENNGLSKVIKCRKNGTEIAS
jgi:hypothetical protein